MRELRDAETELDVVRVGGSDTGADFEAHRDHLMAVAYRMLGSRSEAEDAVQEAWLRYAGARRAPASYAADSAKTAESADSDDAADHHDANSDIATDPADHHDANSDTDAADSATDAADSAETADSDSAEPIRDARAWLTTTTARICLDVLRSARVRRETYVGPWLPEPVVSRLPGSGVVAGTTLSGWLAGEGPPASGFAPDPAERAARTEQVSLALLVVLERLTPEQRVAFVLHDVFAVPFEEVGEVLGTNAAAARQLAARARRAVTGPDAPRHTADPVEQRRVLSAFLTAAESGDLAGLLAVLAPDAIAMGDGGGVVKGAGRRPIVTADKVGRFILGLYRRLDTEPADILLEPVLVNGDLGLLYEARYHTGETVRMVSSLAVADGRITGIFNQLNPAKLESVPHPDPARSWRPPG